MILDIKLCGLINTVEMFFLCSLELSNPLNPLGVMHPTEQCGNVHPFIF